jgi:hypothetical protein
MESENHKNEFVQFSSAGVDFKIETADGHRCTRIKSKREVHHKGTKAERN